MSKKDVLSKFREELGTYISENYETVELFCWEKGVNKATVSNFLNSKKDFQVSTLEKLAKAMGKKLQISLR